MYLAPAWLASLVLRRLRPGIWHKGLLIAVTAATQSLIYFDLKLYELYGFHFNGFVWNLITTQGGLDSLGVHAGNFLAAAAVIAGYALALSAAMFVARLHIALRVPSTAFFASALLLTSIVERSVYAWSFHTGQSAVLEVAQGLPGYQTTRATHVLARLGIPATRHTQGTLTTGRGSLHYPRKALETTAIEQPANIVLLVAESWRADSLTAEVMPSTSRFADQALRFDNHYSGGNGTRMGMFTLFYGLHGTYWHQFLRERQPPVLVDHMQSLGFNMLAQTSARFTYPEFDRTVFASMPSDALHEDDEGPSWQRDRRNVDRAIRWLGAQSADRPFFLFQFFESPHASYDFPEDSTLFPEYARTVNYLALDSASDPVPLKNRYLNAVHHLDQQIGRVLDALRTNGQLANTIVVITGDHGEEFNEKGHWGHNSEFTNEQLRVPLILSLPGEEAQRIHHLTSHEDIAPTLLSRLGITSQSSVYSHGIDLMSNGRTHVVAADWARIAYMDSDYKLVFSTDTSTAPTPITKADDASIANQDAVLRAYVARVAELLRELSQFSGTSAT